MRAHSSRRTLVSRLGLACALGATALGGPWARAQRFETSHALTVVVGAPGGPAPQDRVDGARSARSSTVLPTGTLRIAWRRNLSDSGGALALGPPLVNERGETVVVAMRGDVFFVAEDGSSRGQVPTGEPLDGKATLLADGSVVALGRSGDVIGVRGGAVRFRSPVGADATVTPLALDDGGFVVAARGDLIAFDAAGDVRARARLPESNDAVVGLLGPRATREGPVLYATTEGGAVLEWRLATSRDVGVVGTFGGAIDGNASLAGGSLIAVIEHGVLMALDLDRGTSTMLGAAASAGALDLLGPPAVDPRGDATVLALGTRTLAVTFDPTTAEPRRQSIAPTSLPALPDGGTGAFPILPHVGPLLDAHGTIVFALPTGEVGALATSGSLDVTERVCDPRPGGHGAVVGIAPAGPSAVVVACEASHLVRVEAARPADSPER